VNGSRPFGLVIDFVFNKIYWTDVYEAAIFEVSLDGSSKRTIFSNQSFVPFQVNVLRDFVLASSESSSAYVLVDRSDLSSIIYAPANATFYGLTITNSLKKPSVGMLWLVVVENHIQHFMLSAGQYSCFDPNNGCSHFCEVDETNSEVAFCGCPDGYSLLDDGATCFSELSCILFAQLLIHDST